MEFRIQKNDSVLLDSGAHAHFYLAPKLSGAIRCVSWRLPRGNFIYCREKIKCKIYINYPALRAPLQNLKGNIHHLITTLPNHLIIILWQKSMFLSLVAWTCLLHP